MACFSESHVALLCCLLPCISFTHPQVLTHCQCICGSKRVNEPNMDLLDREHADSVTERSVQSLKFIFEQFFCNLWWCGGMFQIQSILGVPDINRNNMNGFFFWYLQKMRSIVSLKLCLLMDNVFIWWGREHQGNLHRHRENTQHVKLQTDDVVTFYSDQLASKLLLDNMIKTSKP